MNRRVATSAAYKERKKVFSQLLLFEKDFFKGTLNLFK